MLFATDGDKGVILRITLLVGNRMMVGDELDICARKNRSGE